MMRVGFHKGLPILIFVVGPTGPRSLTHSFRACYNPLYFFYQLPQSFFYWKSKALGNYRNDLSIAVCLVGLGRTKERMTVKVTVPFRGIYRENMCTLGRSLLCVPQENSYLEEGTNSPWGASELLLRWLLLPQALIYLNYYLFQKLISCHCLRLAFREGLQFIFKIANYMTIITS